MVRSTKNFNDIVMSNFINTLRFLILAYQIKYTRKKSMQKQTNKQTKNNGHSSC